MLAPHRPAGLSIATCAPSVSPVKWQSPAGHRATKRATDPAVEDAGSLRWTTTFGDTCDALLVLFNCLGRVCAGGPRRQRFLASCSCEVGRSRLGAVLSIRLRVDGDLDGLERIAARVRAADDYPTYLPAADYRRF